MLKDKVKKFQNIYYVLLKKIYNIIDKVAEFLIDKRYIIATVLFIILILMKINISSINEWSNYIGNSESKNVFLGKSRAIRSDEWLVQSAMMISQTQGEDAFKIYNNHIAQGSLNMLMVAAPVKDILIISKPLMWGFLLFGTQYGFSFYWILKIIAIIMVSIELVLKITKNDKLLSLVGGLLLGLAPAMMWWFSSSIGDGYIYGTMTIVLFGYYMKHLEYKIWKKILLAIGLLISITGFAFVLYPAFQVPFAYLMAIFIFVDFIPNIKKLKKEDYIIIGITVLGIAGLLTRYVLLCFNDIKIMMSTVYPGHRIVTGGGFSLEEFISYFENIFFPYSNNILNPCEPSSYIYPVTGLIILIIYCLGDIKNIKKDSNYALIISLVFLYFIYIIWEFVGFGEKLATLTFMSMSPTKRTHVILGIIGTILSIIMINKYDGKKIFTTLQSVIISFCVTILSYVLVKNTNYTSFFTPIKFALFLPMMYTMTYFFITGNKRVWCYEMTIIALLAGAFVNPICHGISPITDTKISYAIKEIDDADEGDFIWAGNNNIAGQYLMANGVNVINGVNTYPNFKLLNKIDPEKEYNEVYNRYAHIHIVLGENINFELLNTDAYQITLTYQKVKELGIRYYYTLGKCTDEIEQKFNLELKYSDEYTHQYIYQIN